MQDIRLIDSSNKILKIEEFVLVPTYFTMYLKCIHQIDNIHFNFSVVIQVRVAYQHILDNLEDQGVKIDYKTDKSKAIQDIEEILCDPEIRVNERPCLDFKEYQISREDLQSREKIKVGKILEQRLDFQNININVHEDLKMQPFDVQSLKLRIEFTSKIQENITLRYNLHNCIPTKNQIFGVQDSPNLDNMDYFNLYKNKKGYSFKIVKEEKKQKVGKGKTIICYQQPIIEQQVRMWRDPGYCFKVAILPMIILVFFASGVNQQGQLDVQQESLLVFYLSFLSFMQVANSGIQKTNTIHLVDQVIIVSYILTLLQQLILILNRFPQYLTEISEGCDPSELNNAGNPVDQNGNPVFYPPGNGYDDVCTCNVQDLFDSRRINILALSSFWITLMVSIIITLSFIVYQIYFHFFKITKYTEHQELRFSEEDPFDFNDWYIMTEGEIGEVVWDYNQKNQCIL